ncbi:undecaprenyl-phosphate glucose phosphotransferase [Pseudorhodoplanes sp.]|uniref:undecaprenyl-phosphate glucose phosphotransferase n=1 Tax=Pseudorhodoplanes sp. TaxID=1934341 RepID=UPI002BD7B5C1|nr:undecaprenyl-phosphate glucose phosphotransferase [Pseudorhodoplanes sp.]HWV51981.1 undecaprenyl-phosphate glucose phosphotransferase [Pseudorhodoplanes sp.]
MIAAGADAATIILVSVGTGILYHKFAYQDAGPVADYVQVGLMTALLYLVPCLYRDEYLVTKHLKFDLRPAQIARYWTFAFICLVIIGFLTKTSVLYSRGWLVLFYAAGLVSLLCIYALRLLAFEAANRLGLIAGQRLFLVGTEADIREFTQRYNLLTLGCRIVGIGYLARDNRATSDAARQLDQSVDRAVAKARAVDPDNVLLIAPWSNQATIDRCIDAFMTLPCSISLAPERILERFDQISIEKLGPIASLHLLHPPMSGAATAIKRAFDIACSALLLVLLLPLFAVIAILIKLDSPGPVLFRQQRYGFNQKSFLIYKFRTMSTLEDGADVRQATRNDSRVTRIGHFMRRWSIDELPQILNVLKGDMSLVGPRPHALAHDRAWSEKIGLYARRHNVKPGITGWAQINGFRGGIVADDQLRGRILCDLYYIDNWSIWLDIKILFATAFSKGVHRNAY